jgi:4,5-dihydroxyphthalate decarboxylase
MNKLELSFAMTRYDRIQPLITGEVVPEGITLHYLDMPVPDIFYRQLKFQQFDVSEMSLSLFLIARAKGWPYRALPIYHNHQFVYSRLVVHEEAGIERPEDLKGKRLGVFDYQQSGALWLRGQLQHEFGVTPQDMEWYMERAAKYSLAAAAGGFQPPPGLRFHYAETDLAKMFLERKIDAGFGILPHGGGAALERPKQDLAGHPKLKKLFANPRQEAIRHYQKTGFVPIHHTTVVRESLLEKHPWIANSLFDAFEKAKSRTYQHASRYPALASVFLFGREELEEQRTVFGRDPYPYGLKANAKAFDLLQTYSVEQGLTNRKQPWDELFPEELLIAEERLG